MRSELELILMAAQEMRKDELPLLLGELEQVRCVALARLTSAPVLPQASDELLDVAEAARRLGASKDYLYRHHRDFAFARRLGRKLLFSATGIEKHIRQQSILTAGRHSK
jgi:hypothetical protein